MDPMSPMTRDERLAAIASCCHEANRAWCVAHGDASQPMWAEAPDWQRESALTGVAGVIAGNGPEESHLSWLAEKERTGWRYGPVKDPEAKTHPCFVPYDQLPDFQKVKDAQFVAIVRALAPSLGLLPDDSTRAYTQISVSDLMLAELGQEWSPPVQVRVTGTELRFRRLARHEFTDEELAAAGGPFFDDAAKPEGTIS